MKLQGYDDSWQPTLNPIPGTDPRESLENNRGPRYTIHCDDHDLPYITAVAWPAPEDPEERARYIAVFEDRSPHLTRAMANGERIFNLTLDNRFGIDAPESELERWAWFLANAMAVAAGYTSHGRNSRRINRHGPSRV